MIVQSARSSADIGHGKFSKNRPSDTHPSSLSISIEEDNLRSICREFLSGRLSHISLWIVIDDESPKVSLSSLSAFRIFPGATMTAAT